MTATVGCVVLTQGDRPDELRRALESVLSQRGVEVDAVVVGNGCAPDDVPPGVTVVPLAENVGIPEGRNRGVASVSGELLVFVDDDAWLSGPDVLAELVALFAADRTLGLVQPRFRDPDGLPTPRQWVPRLRVGGWPACFYYAHEGVDLAWRVWNAGLRVRYAGDVVVHHRAVSPQRHSYFHRYNARNRVLLARRQLPVPLAVVYLGTWTVLTLVRAPSTAARLQALHGFWEGFRSPCDGRSPLRWRAVWRMTRAGRPPVI
jgi:GT2 family glycosyltransferase